jgi:hypothetical protein
VRKDYAQELDAEVAKVAQFYSDPNREYNYAKETYIAERVVPLSETTAAIVFMKEPTGKKSVAFFYRTTTYWRHIFVTDSHILGMESGVLGKLKTEVEEHNYPMNFFRGAGGSSTDLEQARFAAQALGQETKEEPPLEQVPDEDEEDEVPF